MSNNNYFNINNQPYQSLPLSVMHRDDSLYIQENSPARNDAQWIRSTGCCPNKVIENVGFFFTKIFCRSKAAPDNQNASAYAPINTLKHPLVLETIYEVDEEDSLSASHQGHQNNNL